MKKYLPILFWGLLMASCTTDIGDSLKDRVEGGYELVVHAEIADASKSRAVVTEINDEWSYTEFETNDVMGFYSPSGNWMVDNGHGPFENTPLTYNAELKQFTGPNGTEFSPSNMSSNIYMYYPYKANMTNIVTPGTSDGDDGDPDDGEGDGDGEGGDEGITPVQGVKGMELRRYKDPNKPDTLRCLDYLDSYKIELSGVVDNKKVALFGEFDHAFAELIIMRGEGFDNPPDGKYEITAVMREGITNIRVNLTQSPWSLSPELIYDPDNSHNLDYDDAKRWDAWLGGNYGKTVTDPVGKTAWYVIVPTLGCKVGPKQRSGYRGYVEYIELYDNDGYLQRVSGLLLSGGKTKYVDAGWRYPMEITMKELVPTVNPFPIIPWNPDVDLTDQRERGINNITEFDNWLKLYNLYLQNSNDQNTINQLLNYGDQYVDSEGNSSWHFYLLSNINVSGYSFVGADGTTSLNYIIPTLNDILDGKGDPNSSGVFNNYSIIGLDKTFVNTIGSGGSLQNIDFTEPEIKLSDLTDPVGFMVNTMNGGSILNCNIEDGNLMAPGVPAGFVAGKINDTPGKTSEIKNCTLTGFLVAESTSNYPYAEKIVGVVEDGSTPVLEGNDASDVIME